VRVLLDTCVLSELRRPKPNTGVLKAVGEFAGEDLFVSVLSIGEIAKGISRLRDSHNKRNLELASDS
jgi:predicted nucleic acid-binding protein